MSFFEAKQLTIISTNVGQSEARVDEAHVGWSHNKKSRLAKKLRRKERSEEKWLVQLIEREIKKYMSSWINN